MIGKLLRFFDGKLSKLKIVLLAIIYYLSCVLFMAPFIHVFTINSALLTSLAVFGMGACVWIVMMALQISSLQYYSKIHAINKKEYYLLTSIIISVGAIMIGATGLIFAFTPLVFLVLGIIELLSYFCVSIWIVFKYFSNNMDSMVKSTFFIRLRIFGMIIIFVMLVIWLLI